MTNLPGVAAHEWSKHPFILRLDGYIDLSAAEKDSLRALIEAKIVVKRRRDLVVDGLEYRKLCFIAEGFAVRYKLLRNGKRQVLNVLLPGDVVGLPGSFLERAASSVIAVSDMTIHACAFDAYVQLCYRRPKFGLALSWLAVHEAAFYAEHLTDAGRRAPTERLARFLLEIHARLAMVARASEVEFELPFSQEVLGDALGLSVPHLNRTLAQLRSEGLLTLNKRRVQFTDMKGLQLLSQFQPLALARIPERDQSAEAALSS
jgi:CRP-like cAMP-binding protein